MRGLLVVLAIILLMAFGGWLIFSFDDNRMSVEFDADKAKQDTSEAVDKAGEVVDRATNSIRDATEKATADEGSSDPADAPVQ